MYWDVCDREGIKIQDCYVSALPSAWALFRRHLGFAANRLLGMLFSNVCRWFHCSKSTTSRCVISLNILPFFLKESFLLSGDAHARRPLHKMDGVFVLSGDTHARRPLHKMDGVFFKRRRACASTVS